jgi:hypothetical protein
MMGWVFVLCLFVVVLFAVVMLIVSIANGRAREREARNRTAREHHPGNREAYYDHHLGPVLDALGPHGVLDASKGPGHRLDYIKKALSVLTMAPTSHFNSLDDATTVHIDAMTVRIDGLIVFLADALTKLARLPDVKDLSHMCADFSGFLITWYYNMGQKRWPAAQLEAAKRVRLPGYVASLRFRRDVLLHKFSNFHNNAVALRITDRLVGLANDSAFMGRLEGNILGGRLDANFHSDSEAFARLMSWFRVHTLVFYPGPITSIESTYGSFFTVDLKLVKQSDRLATRMVFHNPVCFSPMQRFDQFLEDVSGFKWLRHLSISPFCDGRSFATDEEAYFFEAMMLQINKGAILPGVIDTPVHTDLMVSFVDALDRVNLRTKNAMRVVCCR